MITNLEKKLDALIDALGFEVETITGDVDFRLVMEQGQQPPNIIGYKLTKKETDQEEQIRIAQEIERYTAFSGRKLNP